FRCYGSWALVVTDSTGFAGTYQFWYAALDSYVFTACCAGSTKSTDAWFYDIFSQFSKGDFLFFTKTPFESDYTFFQSIEFLFAFRTAEIIAFPPVVRNVLSIVRYNFLADRIKWHYEPPMQVYLKISESGFRLDCYSEIDSVPASCDYYIYIRL